jgi:hypothetical protein
MNKVDKEMTDLWKRLDALQRHKAKLRPPKKVKSFRPHGRPRIDEKIIEKAKELGQIYPLPFVAFKLDISMSSFYRYGIKRKILNAENEAKTKSDSPSELSPETITD